MRFTIGDIQWISSSYTMIQSFVSSSILKKIWLILQKWWKIDILEY